MSEKMDITMWMVIKNDEYYVDMALLSCLPYVKNVYVQDQGSTDGSREKIADTINFWNEDHPEPVNYLIEIEDTGLKRFDPEYNEPHYRSLAIRRATDIFGAKWLLQCDADDMFTPWFFVNVMEMERSGILDKFNSIRHASERFITPEYRAWDPNIQMIKGVPYIDPHTRLWKAEAGCQYVLNPAFKNTFLHCVLQPHPGPEYWLPGICNIHLHRTFGPKSWLFWEEGGDVFERKIPFNPKRQASKWFNAEVNMGKAMKITDDDYVWPKFVMKKWREWMVYD